MKTERQLLLMICNKLGIDPDNYKIDCVHEWEKDTSIKPDGANFNRICKKCDQKETEYMGGSCE